MTIKKRSQIGTLLILTIIGSTKVAAKNIAANDPQRAVARISQSVVKIMVTSQRDDPRLPWQASPPRRGNGSGFIIKGRKIFTNAHVVSDARFIEVQRHGDSRRYIAEVLYTAIDCDLAILQVNDPDFFNGTQPVTFADDLPELGDSVIAVGFPLGGGRVSLTRGIVSRIDYSLYSHSGVDYHLVMQVDAAINPGNSGGPLLDGRHVVGVAFQGLSRGDNIGYAIPLPVIQRFLQDIADGHYHGYPELGLMTLELQNPALRDFLALPDKLTGIAVTYTDPLGSAHNVLRPGDVLLSIDDFTIREDSTIDFQGIDIEFTEVIERKQRGDSVKFEIWREGKRHNIELVLQDILDPFIFRNTFDEPPEYVVKAGLVFSPLSRDILRASGDRFDHPHEQRLLYLARYAKIDNLFEDFSQMVILSDRLPHPINAYAQAYLPQWVTAINGHPIRQLRDVLVAFSSSNDGYIRIDFFGSSDPLILPAADLQTVDATIQAQYGIANPFRFAKSEEANREE